MVESGIDCESIANLANLTAVSPRVLRAECKLLHALAQSMLDSAQEEKLVKRLGPYGHQVWITRLRTNYYDLSRIRAFCAEMTPQTQAQIAMASRWKGAPDWWKSKHDVALLRALCDYGLLFSVVWMVDPHLPFRAHIPPVLIPEYMAVAEVERKSGVARELTNLGDFAQLLPEKRRMARALSLIDFVNAKMEQGAQNPLEDDDSQNALKRRRERAPPRRISRENARDKGSNEPSKPELLN
jgi:chromodomain-helicase-DNA-binding protein 7